MAELFKIEVELILYRADKGRSYPVVNNYRPKVYFGVTDVLNPNFATDCIIQLKNIEFLNPGDTAVVYMFLLKSEHLQWLMMRGNKLKIKEGVNYVGEGTILGVFGMQEYIK